VEHDSAALQAQLRAAHPHHPGWMPLCKSHALAWAHAPHASNQHLRKVGLSFPKLLPVRQADWTSCFPGTTDRLGWWTPTPGTTPYFETSAHGWHALTRKTLRTEIIPWGQEDETLGTTRHGNEGVETTAIAFQWRAFTPTIPGLARALQPILARHRASALMVGVGEATGHTEPVHVVHWPEDGQRPTAYNTSHDVAEPETTALQPIWAALLQSPLHPFHNSLFPS
jgi:hypothetical protein